MKHLYRGIWAENLNHGDSLPVGGTIFGDELSIHLNLDFESIISVPSAKWNPETIQNVYEKNEAQVKKWLSHIDCELSPYLMFVARSVQESVNKNLEVESNSVDLIKRNSLMMSNEANLSDFVGNSACVERAALGQYLLQHGLTDNYWSAYMSGVATNEDPALMGDHSFILLGDSNNTYVFDITRPISMHNLPRIQSVSPNFNYETLSKTKNLLFEAREVFRPKTLFYGVGNPGLVYDPKIVKQE